MQSESGYRCNRAEEVVFVVVKYANFTDDHLNQKSQLCCSVHKHAECLRGILYGDKVYISKS